MTIQLARQRDLPSLVRNGNFGSGLAHWLSTPGTRHGELRADSIIAASLVNSPRFFATIPAGGSISQIITRNDAFIYPSRRFVENLEAVPIGIDTLDLRPNATTTTDGIPFTSGVDPFAYEDQEGSVGMVAGTQVELDDLNRKALSGPYRIGRTLVSDAGTPQEITSVQASPINGTIVRLAYDTDFLGTLYTRDGSLASPRAVIEVIGIHEFDRQHDTNTVLGFRPNDVLVITEPDFYVARVIQVDREVDRYQLTVVPVRHAPFLPATNNATNSQVIDTVALTEWFVSPITKVSVIRELPLYQYDLTLAYSYFPRQNDGVPKLEFVNRAGKVQTVVPRHVLENGAFEENLSVSENANLATIYRRRLVRFFGEFRAPVRGLLRLTIAAGSGSASIGDVVLYKGNFTRRHDRSDDDDPTLSVVADSRSILDRMLHGVDYTAGVIPRGAVLLYTGGAVCPDGYKRVDSLPLSKVDGLETLPAPDGVAYEADRNRTVMVWDTQSFDLLDDFGQTIPILSDVQDVQIQLPPQAPFRANFETIQLGPVQQRVQPGMSLRIRFSDNDTDAARRFDYSVLIRQALVERNEVTGAVNGVTYPTFMSSGDFSPEEVYFDPIGPPASGQPTAYSGASPFAVPTPGTSLKGTAANPAPFSGLTPGAPYMQITGVQLGPLAVGELIYIRWSSASIVIGQATSGAFIGRVAANDGAGNVSIERADGNGMIVPGRTSAVAGTASISDARTFGSDVLVTRTVIGTTVVWSARRFVSSFKLTVFGDVTADVTAYNQGGLVLEPSGFIRFGKSGEVKPFDYGSMGHSHEVTQGDAPANTDIAPHVNAGNENLPSSVVAYKHGHGYLPKFIFPIPEFVAYLLCEKL